MICQFAAPPRCWQAGRGQLHLVFGGNQGPERKFVDLEPSALSAFTTRGAAGSLARRAPRSVDDPEINMSWSISTGCSNPAWMIAPQDASNA
jgi:hypothetical protein